MLFNELNVSEKCSSQQFGILDHSASRVHFIIRCAERKLSLPKLQQLFLITIKGCSHRSSVNRQ